MGNSVFKDIIKGSKEGKVIWEKVVSIEYKGRYEGYEIVVDPDEKTMTVLKDGKVETMVKEADELLLYVEKNVGKRSIFKRILGET